MNSMNRPLTPSLSPSEGDRVAGGRVRGRFMVPMRGWKTVGTAMNVIQSLLVGLFFVCLFNCVNANDRSLLIRSLAKGALSGIKEAKQEVIRDAAAWERFRKQHSISEQSVSLLNDAIEAHCLIGRIVVLQDQQIIRHGQRVGQGRPVQQIGTYLDFKASQFTGRNRPSIGVGRTEMKDALGRELRVRQP